MSAPFVPRTDWKDEPDKSTPVYAVDLIKFGTGIRDVDVMARQNASDITDLGTALTAEQQARLDQHTADLGTYARLPVAQTPGFLATVGADGDSVVYAAPPASGGDGLLKYRGAYAAGDYAVDDLVTSAGRLLRCKSAHTAGDAVITVVGATSAAYPIGTVTNVALPAGSQAGDLAMIATCLFTNTTGDPAGATLVTTMPVASNDGGARVLSYHPTSADIAAGTIAFPSQAQGGHGVTVTVFRGPVDINTAGTRMSASLDEPAAAPSGPGYLYHVCFGFMATPPGVQAALDHVVTGAGQFSVASGCEPYTSEPVTARSWTWGTAPGAPASGVIPLGITPGVPDPSKWDVLSAS